MIKREEFIIESLNKKSICFDIHFSTEKKGTIIFSHGIMGFKDWGHFNLMAQTFALKGYDFVKLNFSHNGTSPESLNDFVDLEAFGQNNFSHELDDLDRLLEYLKINQIDLSLNLENIHLIGHSKGGATSLIYTLNSPQIKSCATLAPVIYPVDRYSDLNDSNSEWKTQGVKFRKNSRTDQDFPMYYQLSEDSILNKDRFNIIDRLPKDKRSFLILHGLSDEAVLPSEPSELMDIKNADVIFLEEADHVFGGKHPFEEPELPPHTSVAIDLIVDFFDANS